ncbi:MAG TPA: malto-oligosyltrehalose trehalohydrolase, partial [Rubrivivax sp.]|nr:malto-oligosyltrehalose trehalohydrolase [Rubrivivax sp.]
MQHVHAMPFGATLLPGGGARFALWAPAARSVELVLPSGSGAPVVTAAANAKDEGWYVVEQGAVSAGQRYQWRIDGNLLVPDPASRSNPEGPHGASQLVDPAGFEWADNDWRGRPWHEAVLYELHVGCFTAEGTFAAAAAELPRLADLGITAVQLMPLADFPGSFGWGYDGVLPYAPYHGYGTPDDLKRFVQTAHRLGLMVFGDVVYNHFGPDGNYLHAYAPQFFSSTHSTAWGPALNFDGEAAATVREFIIHNALYWVEEFRFDGLRLDAVHAMLDDSAEHILKALSKRVRAACADRHVHLVLENDSNDETLLGAPGTPGLYDGQWNGDLHHTLHVLLTGERDGYYAEYDAPLQQLARCLTHGFARQGGPHNAEGAEPRRPAQGQAPLLAVVNLLHNHDQIGNRAFGERLQQLAEPAAMRLATALLLLSPTTPLLFMGEELGSAAPFLYFADWQGGLRAAVQEGRKAEFAHFERYAQAAKEGRLPDPCSRDTFERCKLGAGAAVHPNWADFYVELLARRRHTLQPWLGQLAARGHRSEVQGALLQVWWDFGGRQLHMQANLG